MKPSQYVFARYCGRLTPRRWIYSATLIPISNKYNTLRDMAWIGLPV